MVAARIGLTIVLLSGLLLTACGGTVPVAINPAREAIQTDIQSAPLAEVGSQVEVQLTIKNVGTVDIPNLVVTGLLTAWKRHNALLSVGPSSCTERLHSAEGDVLVCGRVAAGGSITVDIQGEAKDAGSFTYLVSFRDDHNNFTLQETDGKAYSYSIDESVAPPPG